MTPRERLKLCLLDESVRAPRASQMVALVNESEDYYATIRPCTTNTDRKVGRLCIPGVGREGHRVEVYRKSDRERLIRHDTSETYRTNRELAEQIAKLLKLEPYVCGSCAAGRHCCTGCDCC